MDSYLFFEHPEPSHSEHHVRNQVPICIALICKSKSDTLSCFQTWKCGGSYWSYWCIGYMKVCNVLCCIIVTFRSIYMHDLIYHNIVSFTPPSKFIVEKNHLEKNRLFLDFTWKIIRSIEKLRHCILIPPHWTDFHSLQLLLLLRSLNIQSHFKTWNHSTNSFFLYPPLKHMGTFFIS